jgi:hypothetical protein
VNRAGTARRMPSGNLVRRADSSFLLVLVSWIQGVRVNSCDDADIRHVAADPPATAVRKWWQRSLRSGCKGFEMRCEPAAGRALGIHSLHPVAFPD